MSICSHRPLGLWTRNDPGGPRDSLLPLCLTSVPLPQRLSSPPLLASNQIAMTFNVEDVQKIMAKAFLGLALAVQGEQAESERAFERMLRLLKPDHESTGMFGHLNYAMSSL
jgi:hypothetical protein